MASDKSDALTPAQKEQLEAELAELEGPRRAEAVQAIATARSFGDLSENFEYHAAKNEQGLLERRITMLRDRLERSVILDENAVVRRHGRRRDEGRDRRRAGRADGGRDLERRRRVTGFTGGACADGAAR